MCQPNMQTSKFMTLQQNFIPRGCYKEIRKYNICKNKPGATDEACFADKISIMEVCPEHVLEGLREKKKWYLRAEVIDNETYKRAMEVSNYNKGRSVSDLKLKTWAYGAGSNLRSDTLWQDDRYDPTKFSHPHRYDNVNFPEQEFKDFFGGTIGNAEMEDYEKHRLGLTSGVSQAMRDYHSARRVNKLRDAVKAVDELN